MAKQIREQNQEGLAVSLGRLINGATQGIGGLLGFAAELERQGKSEYEERGAIEGETKSGKKIRGAYGLRVKVGLPVRSQEAEAGLNPEDPRNFRDRREREVGEGPAHHELRQK